MICIGFINDLDRVHWMIWVVHINDLSLVYYDPAGPVKPQNWFVCARGAKQIILRCGRPGPAGYIVSKLIKNQTSGVVYYINNNQFLILSAHDVIYDPLSLIYVWVQKSSIWHWDQNSFFSFDESLLDAESSLEHVLDTNLTSFLRRFWIRYQNGITSDLQKVTFLVLQVVLFSKILHGGLPTAWTLCFSFGNPSNKTKYQ